MSHFTVLVIGDNPELQLEPFEEEADKKYLVFKDIEEESLKEYQEGTCKEFYCSSNSSWGQSIHPMYYRAIKLLGIGEKLSCIIIKETSGYFTKGCKYKVYPSHIKEYPGDLWEWIEVTDIFLTNHPDENVCFTGEIEIKRIAPPKSITFIEKYDNFKTFMELYHGIDKDPDTGKYGYWVNPNAKWDWYELGGRWSGFFIQHNNEPTDQTIKQNIDFDSMRKKDKLSTFAVLKDGVWYEKGEMGWWCSVTDEKPQEDWDIQFNKLLDEIKDDELLSLYDCHI